MKKNFRLLTKKRWAVVICTFFSCVFLGTAQAQTERTFENAGTTEQWQVPTNVTQITIETWGAGGAGGATHMSSLQRPAGGGGGGAYAKSTIAVTPGEILSITVGRGGENPNGTARDGENSSVKRGTTTLVEAEGGKSVGGTNTLTGAQGGQASNSIGDVKFSGGNGGNGEIGSFFGAYSASGGGGGAAGNHGNGYNGGNGESGSSGSAGAAGAAGDGDEIAGNGGEGLRSTIREGWDGVGKSGSNYGGGGGGSINTIVTTTKAGGQGGDGYIRISYEEALQVSYVLNGATNPTSIPEGMINPGDPMSSVKPGTIITKDNHTFEGWFYDAACTQAVDWSANCTQTSNFILYAKWTLNQITVHFNTNGGTPTLSDEQIIIGAAMSTVQPATNPTRTGYNFVGWFYDEALTNAVVWSANCTATTDFTLYAKWESALAATFDKVNDVTCYGGNDGKINIYISDGVAPFTYTLTGAETRNDVAALLGDNAVENLAAGSYNITVKDNSGKEVPATPAQITIYQPEEMTPVVLTSTTNPCATGITEIVINATGETGYTYTWSAPAGVIATPSGTGNSTLTLSNLGAATTFNYSVTATADGCTTTANGTFTIGAAQVEITAGIAELCDGERTSLTAQAENVASYIWSTGDTTRLINTPADAAAGNNTYSVTITNTLGCTATDDITIVTHPAVETVAGTSYDICSGQGFNYTPSVSSTSLTYTWTIASNEGVTGYAAQSTPTAAPIAGTNLRNSSNEILTVVYEVTPWEGSCSGTPFNVTVNVKPSIENATVSFYDADVNITLYYGACDTLYYVETPTYTTDYEGTLTLSNNVSSVNSGTILGRIAPGTYTIVWTLTDECGNSRNYTKNYIVNYPPCGTDLTAIDTDNNTYQTVRIGCECWTKSNLRTTTYSDGSDVAFARAYSSQAYPDTTANKANFGLLYTWYSAVNVAEGNDTAEPEVKTASGSGYPYVQGVCPEGWAIPSMAQYYNAVSTVANIDGMKSTDINKWLPEHAGTDESGFSAVGAGFYNAGLGFESLLGKTWFWSYDQNIHTAQSASIGYYCNEMLNEEQPKGMGFSVRCIKRDSGEDTPTSAQACPGVPTVTDVDGNVYNTVLIGDQCWMRENLKTTKYANGTNIPLGTTISYDVAYRYYPNDNSANVTDYGYLYNWAAVMNGSASSEANPSGVQGICPDGWHVPSDAEWTELTNYVSSQSQYVCGGDEGYIAKALASEEGWNSNTDNCAVGYNPITNNATGFSARPAGGYYDLFGGDYKDFGYEAMFWSATQYSNNNAYSRYLLYYNATVDRARYVKCNGNSVRCVRNEEGSGSEGGDDNSDDNDTTITAQACPGVPTVTDVDGNVYNTVQIGDQCWMRENLKTTKYANGTNIPLGTDTSSTTAYRYYPDDNSANVTDYGYLYNWAAVMNGSASSEANPSGVQGICPDGWHVPSDAEWTELENYVSSQSQYVCGGDEDNIAKALASEVGWNSSTRNCAVGNNPSANNATGFSARPAGDYYGSYYSFGSYAYFWSATQHLSNGAYVRSLNYSNANVSRYHGYKDDGYSVRCVRN